MKKNTFDKLPSGIFRLDRSLHLCHTNHLCNWVHFSISFDDSNSVKTNKKETEYSVCMFNQGNAERPKVKHRRIKLTGCSEGTYHGEDDIYLGM